MKHPIPEITPAELRIMKHLWRIGDATVGDVKELLGDEGDDKPAYTTVMTMMKQLAEKGALEVDKSRQPFVYRPAVRRDQVLTHRLLQFLHTVFDGQAGELVARLVEEDQLSPEELKRIEAKIERSERGDDTDSTPGSKKSQGKGGKR
ncbi:MAG TPA: BlaI/MecI/CopY family transcriptional regulator [Phycisphaerae bacterium]|nr:BlaI/MecI/CopY family transcriptional regulator [Phycisphaerae bacterium]